MSTLDDFHLTLVRSQRFPDEHTCPRGAESGRSGAAVWQQDNGCSYCGSLHPDVFMERVEAGDVLLGSTSKNYKVYVHAKDGTPAFQTVFRGDDCPGGNDPSKWKWTTQDTRDCKFYFQHLSQAQMQRFVELMNAKRLEFKGGYGFTVMPFFVARSACAKAT